MAAAGDDRVDRRVLAVAVPAERIAPIDPVLRRRGIEVDRVTASAAAALVEAVRFDLLVLGGPAAVVEPVLRAVRGGGPSHRSSVIALAEPNDATRWRPLAERYGVRVTPPGTSEEELQSIVATFLDTAARLAVRVTVRIEVEVADETVVRITQTEDLSRTGMLIRSRRTTPVGAPVRFDLMLPAPADPISGSGTVVRHHERPGEGPVAVGVRFDRFVGDGGERLLRFLAEAVEGRSADDVRHRERPEPDGTLDG